MRSKLATTLPFALTALLFLGACKTTSSEDGAAGADAAEQSTSDVQVQVHTPGSENQTTTFFDPSPTYSWYSSQPILLGDPNQRRLAGLTASADLREAARVLQNAQNLLEIGQPNDAEREFDRGLSLTPAGTTRLHRSLRFFALNGKGRVAITRPFGSTFLENQLRGAELFAQADAAGGSAVSQDLRALNIGLRSNALAVLGSMQNKANLLRESITANTAEIESGTTELSPSTRGLLRATLAYAQYNLARLEPDTALLRQALANADVAAPLLSANPTMQATIDFTRGSALTALAGLEVNRIYAERGLTAYERALDSMERKSNPLIWAELQSGKADASLLLHSFEQDPKRLRTAIAAAQAALEIMTPEIHAPTWAYTRSVLGLARGALASSLANEDPQNPPPESRRLMAAADADFRAVLEAVTASSARDAWLNAKLGLGLAFAFAFATDAESVDSKEALRHAEEALALVDIGREPLLHAFLRLNLAVARIAEGAQALNAGSIQQAIDILDETAVPLKADPRMASLYPRLESARNLAEEMVRMLANRR